MQQQQPMMRKLSNAEEIELNVVAPSVPQGPRLMRQLSANANMGDHQPINPQMRARNSMFTDLKRTFPLCSFLLILQQLIIMFFTVSTEQQQVVSALPPASDLVVPPTSAPVATDPAQEIPESVAAELEKLEQENSAEVGIFC